MDVLLVVGVREAYVYLCRPYPHTVAVYANLHFLAETHEARQRGARVSSWRNGCLVGWVTF